MTQHNIVWEIAKWEFRRWFKLKDQVLTLVIALGVGIFFWGGMALLAGSDDPAVVRVVDRSGILMPQASDSRITFEQASPAEEQLLRDKVGRKELDGLLIIENIDEAELIVFKKPVWKGEVERMLGEARLAAKMRELNVPQGTITDAAKPPALTLTIHEAGQSPTSTVEKVIAIIVVILMLLGVFNGVAYQFVSITGEKQLRVTEVIISSVSPQQWIDGKILGTSLHSLASTGTYATSILGFVVVSIPLGSGWTIPVIISDPFVLLSVFAVAIVGYLFWCTLFGAFAATINDPNTSARSSLIMFPALPIGFAFFTLVNPDSIGMKLLSIFPLTSPGVMPARLVLTEVAGWEVFLAVVLLATCVALLRRAAGRIFHLGMLMYGKEPSLQEIWRWMKKT